jgi:hypothetical protein
MGYSFLKDLRATGSMTSSSESSSQKANVEHEEISIKAILRNILFFISISY